MNYEVQLSATFLHSSMNLFNKKLLTQLAAVGLQLLSRLWAKVHQILNI